MATPSRNRIGLIALVIVGILLILVITAYNGLVRNDEAVKKNWGNLQSTYQRRLDLLPNLVSVVRGTAEFESGTLQDLTEARARAAQSVLAPAPANAGEFSRQEQAQAQVVGAANRVIAVIERYPNLRATESFRQLQAQLVGTERRIKIARKDFNAAVADYNNTVRRFPGNLVASVFGFRPREGFRADAGADVAPQITF